MSLKERRSHTYSILLQLPPDVRNRVLLNSLKFYKDPYILNFSDIFTGIFSSKSSVLYNFMSWSSTHEGVNYWRGVS